MSIHYVMIADYEEPDEAQRARASLEHEGIPTMLDDAHADSGILRFVEAASGHLRLKVPSELETRAREVLRTSRDAPRRK